MFIAFKANDKIQLSREVFEMFLQKLWKYSTE